MTELLDISHDASTVHVPGLGVLHDDRPGGPEIITWASIAPDGELRVHTSDNRTAYSERIDERLQWRFLLDVFGVLDPLDRCADHRFTVVDDYLEINAGGIVDDADGMFIVPCSHGDLTVWPENPVASIVLAGARRYGGNIHGTVAWIGFADKEGLPAHRHDRRPACRPPLPRRARQDEGRLVKTRSDWPRDPRITAGSDPFGAAGDARSASSRVPLPVRVRQCRHRLRRLDFWMSPKHPVEDHEMTQGIPSLKLTAAQVVLANPQPLPLPDDLVAYLTNVVELNDIVNEPAAIWQDLNGFLNTVIQLSPEDDEALRDDQTRELENLISRCDRVLQLVQHALEFIEAQDQEDQEWREYYTLKCTEAIDSVTDCKANCELLLAPLG